MVMSMKGNFDFFLKNIYIYFAKYGSLVKQYPQLQVQVSLYLSVFLNLIADIIENKLT